MPLSGLAKSPADSRLQNLREPFQEHTPAAIRYGSLLNEKRQQCLGNPEAGLGKIRLVAIDLQDLKRGEKIGLR